MAAREIAGKLPESQRRALETAHLHSSDGRYRPLAAVRPDVRVRLYEKGLIGSGIGHPLTPLGLKVRAHLKEMAG